MNIKLAKLAAALVLLASSITAHAALIPSASIIVEKAALDINFDGTPTLLEEWSNSIVTETLPVSSASELFKGSVHNQSIFRLTLEFNSNSAASFGLIGAFDAGFGVELYVNGTLWFENRAKVWAGNNLNSSSAYRLEDIDLVNGQNVIEWYWAEDRNSGGNTFGIIDAGTQSILSLDLLQSFQDANNIGNANSINAPTTYGAALAFGFLFLFRNRIQRDSKS